METQLLDIIVDDERILLVTEIDAISFVRNREANKIPAKYVGKFFNRRVYRFNSAQEKTYFLLKWQK